MMRLAIVFLVLLAGCASEGASMRLKFASTELTAKQEALDAAIRRGATGEELAAARADVESAISTYEAAAELKRREGQEQVDYWINVAGQALMVILTGGAFAGLSTRPTTTKAVA